MRKVAVILIICLCALLCACTKTTTTTPLSPEGEQLNLALFQGGFGEAYWMRVIEEFEARHPGTKVNYMIHPKIGDLIRPALLSGDAPDFLYLSDTSSDGVVVSLIQNHTLTDLTDLFMEKDADGHALADRFLSGILQTPGYTPYGDGHIYLAPLSYGPMGLMYNATLFEKHGWSVPETWDELFELGDQARTAGIALWTYPGVYPGYLESLAYPAIANNAGVNKLEALFALDTQVLNDPKALEALDNIRRMAQEGYLLEGSYNMNHLQAQAEWMMDRALFIPNGIWILNETHSAARTEDFTFALAAVPATEKESTHYVQISYEQMSIPKDAKNPELAKEFLRFLYSDESVRIFAEEASGVIPLKGALNQAKELMQEEVYRMYAVFERPGTVSYLNMFDNAQVRSTVSINELVLKSFADHVLKQNMAPEEWSPIILEELRAYENDGGKSVTPATAQAGER